MNNEILQILLDELEKRYGDLNDDSGCYTRNDRWLSVERIAKLIRRIDEEY